MPSLHSDRGEGCVIVAVAPASVQIYRGNLARCPKSAGARAGHGGAKIEAELAVGYIASESVNVGVYSASVLCSLAAGYRNGTTAEAGAIAGSSQRRLEPRLHRDRGSRGASGQGHVEIVVSVGKGLAAESQHVGDTVQVRGLVFVFQNASDVADLERHLSRQLPLNGEIKLIGTRRTEIRIERLAVTSGSVATDAGELNR